MIVVLTLFGLGFGFPFFEAFVPIDIFHLRDEITDRSTAQVIEILGVFLQWRIPEEAEAFVVFKMEEGFHPNDGSIFCLYKQWRSVIEPKVEKWVLVIGKTRWL